MILTNLYLLRRAGRCSLALLAERGTPYVFNKPYPSFPEG